MYKPLADSTLMGMTKKEIIEQLRIAEHNHRAMQETLNQQAKNCIKLLAEERKHGHWTKDNKCSECGAQRPTQGINKWIYLDAKYCYACGAKMDEEV